MHNARSNKDRRKQQRNGQILSHLWFWSSSSSLPRENKKSEMARGTTPFADVLVWNPQTQSTSPTLALLLTEAKPTLFVITGYHLTASTKPLLLGKVLPTPSSGLDSAYCIHAHSSHCLPYFSQQSARNTTSREETDHALLRTNFQARTIRETSTETNPSKANLVVLVSAPSFLLLRGAPLPVGR